MEIKGRVIATPRSKTGVSQKGPCKKAFIVVRYEEGQYPKDIVLSNMRKAEDFERIQRGDTGTFKFDAKAREGSNGEWYCDLECWSWTLDRPQSGDPI